MQKINRDDLLLSYDYNRLYASAQIEESSTWPKIETAYPFTIYMSDAVCSLFSSGRWSELNRCNFLTVNYHNPENLVFQHLPVQEKIKHPYKNHRLEEFNGMRNGSITDTLTSVDDVEIIICGGVILEVYEGFFCHNLEYNPNTEFASDLFEKENCLNHKEKICFKT